MHSRICSAAVALFLLTAAARTRGQGNADKKQAQALQVAGVHLMDQGDDKGALAKFEEAFRLFPSPKILFNMGRAHFALHEEVEALTAFERFLDESPYAPKESREEAERVITQLRPRLSYLDLQVDDNDSKISVDGREVGTAPLARPVIVTPGPHEVRVEKTGLVSSTQTVSPVPGQKLRMVVRLSAAVETAPPPVTAAASPTGPALAAASPAGSSNVTVVVNAAPSAEAPQGHSWHTTAAWISAGAAAAFLVGGITAQALSSSKNGDFNGHVDPTTNLQCNQARAGDGGPSCVTLLDAANSRHTLAIAGFVASGVAAAAALTFYLTTPAGGGSSHAMAALCLPNAQNGGASCSLSLTF
jgi:PEGA domain